MHGPGNAVTSIYYNYFCDGIEQEEEKDFFFNMTVFCRATVKIYVVLAFVIP